MARLQREFYTTLVRCYGVLLLPSVVQVLFLIGYKYSAAYRDVFTIASLFCMVFCVWFIFRSKAEPSYGEIVVSALVCAPAFAILVLLLQALSIKFVENQNPDLLEELILYYPSVYCCFWIGVALGAVGLIGLVLRLLKVPLPVAAVKKMIWAGALFAALAVPLTLAGWIYYLILALFRVANFH